MYSNKIKDIDILQEEINAFRPLEEQELQNLQQHFRVNLTYTSNALEGNSLSELEIKLALVEDNVASKKKDYFEVIGHSKAYDYLLKVSEENIITESAILELHKLFYYHINMDDAGKYRREKISIVGTDFVPPSPDIVPLLMKDFIAGVPNLKKEWHPVEYAALLHKELVTIHPFIHGNGQTARLLMNLALVQNGYVVTVIPPTVRDDYISALRESLVETGDHTPFVNFISCMVYDSQKDYLKLLKALG